MKLKIIAIAHHRNGVAGSPFDVALFKERGREGSLKVAILFDVPAHCAILDVTKLAAGDIAFGSNSWRGDDYEPFLRDAIKANLQQFVDELRKRTWQPEDAMTKDHDIKQSATHTLEPWEHGDNGLIYGQCGKDGVEAPFVCDVIEDSAMQALGMLSPAAAL